MQTIWKFPLKVADYQQIEMPEGAEVLAVQVQHNIPCLWARVTSTNPLVEKGIFIVGTGNRVNEDCGRHLGTFQIANGSLVFHVFEEK